jgi:CheY-like chemotaxis protein
VSPARVLVVDDDDGLRAVIEAALLDEGYEVLVARDGLEALARIEQRPPRLVLLDWMMPRMDGPAFEAALRERGLRARIPILLLTATNRAPERAAQIRAESWLAKPFELPELLEAVERLTDRAACNGLS